MFLTEVQVDCLACIHVFYSSSRCFESQGSQTSKWRNPATPGTSLTFVCWLASSCVATSGSIIKKLWTIGCLPLDPGTFLIVFVWDGSDGSVDHLSVQWSIARLGYLPASAAAGSRGPSEASHKLFKLRSLANLGRCPAERTMIQVVRDQQTCALEVHL